MGQREQLAYNAWRQMVKDAHAATGKSYTQTIDRRWLEQFAHFQADMGLPEIGQALVRRDSSLPFNKSNCFWCS